MNEYREIEVVLAWLDRIAAFGLLYWPQIILGAATGYIALILLRFFIVALGRLLGLYSPDHYRYWPRLPWRPVYRRWSAFMQWYEQCFWLSRRGATGGFASALGVFLMLFKPGMIHLGRASAWGFGLLQPVGIEVKRHLFMLAQTGAGKTTALITIISTWRGSVFVIDPKAQIVNALYQHDKRQWFVFDPDGLSNVGNRVSINFLDCIKEAMQEFGPGAAVLWASRVAEALVKTPSGNRSPYFYDVARNFLAGLILHVLSSHPEEDHHLPCVRDLLVHGYRVYDEDGQEVTQGDEAHTLLLKAMSENPAFGGVIAGAVSAMQSAGGETGGNVQSTLQDQTKFLDLPNVRNAIKTSDISLKDLKRRDDIVLAFVASIYSIREELSPLSRLLTNMLAYIFEAEKKKKSSCLFAIDELPSQGYNSVLEVMIAVGRSMGITFLGIAQNVELMQNQYPKTWKSFIGEADACWWLGCNHPDNGKLLSQMLGKKTLIDKDRDSRRKSYRDVSVMEPEQLSRFLDPNSDHLIVTRAGGRALKLRNEPYYKALPVTAYAPDPDHKEALLRRFVRWVLRR